MIVSIYYDTVSKPGMTKNELFKALASLIIDYGELYILISYQNLLKEVIL